MARYTKTQRDIRKLLEENPGSFLRSRPYRNGSSRFCVFTSDVRPLRAVSSRTVYTMFHLGGIKSKSGSTEWEGKSGLYELNGNVRRRSKNKIKPESNGKPKQRNQGTQIRDTEVEERSDLF